MEYVCSECGQPADLVDTGFKVIDDRYVPGSFCRVENKRVLAVRADCFDRSLRQPVVKKKRLYRGRRMKLPEPGSPEALA